MDVDNYDWVRGTRLPSKENAYNDKVVVQHQGMLMQVYWWAVKEGSWWAEMLDYEKPYTHSKKEDNDDTNQN